MKERKKWMNLKRGTFSSLRNRRGRCHQDQTAGTQWPENINLMQHWACSKKYTHFPSIAQILPKFLIKGTSSLVKCQRKGIWIQNCHYFHQGLLICIIIRCICFKTFHEVFHQFIFWGPPWYHRQRQHKLPEQFEICFFLFNSYLNWKYANKNGHEVSYVDNH